MHRERRVPRTKPCGQHFVLTPFASTKTKFLSALNLPTSNLLPGRLENAACRCSLHKLLVQIADQVAVKKASSLKVSVHTLGSKKFERRPIALLIVCVDWDVLRTGRNELPMPP